MYSNTLSGTFSVLDTAHANLNGPSLFMYVVGHKPDSVRLTIAALPGWQLINGESNTITQREFRFENYDRMVDTPTEIAPRVLADSFRADGRLYRVLVHHNGWEHGQRQRFVRDVEKIVRYENRVISPPPLQRYTFLFHIGYEGGDGMEHLYSTQIVNSAPWSDTATVLPGISTAAHEYFHTWNLMRIRPVEYGDVSYRTPRRSRGLWFSEGLSMFYSDLLRRRAGLPVSTPTRAAHLETAIARYLSNPGYARLSAERVSVAEYGDDPAALGDYSASTHLQGELIAAMMDLEIRHATSGRRSMDDVMRRMMERYSGERGFTGRDVERVIAEVCGCTVSPFFDAHVRGARAIPFDDYLRYIGLRAEVTWRPALGRDGRPAPDLRAFPYELGDGAGVRLKVSDPASAWGKAGLHTGDRLRAINGHPIATRDATLGVLRQLASGDTVHVELERAGVRRSATVVMAPFDRPFVQLREIDAPTSAQRALRAQWEKGAP